MPDTFDGLRHQLVEWSRWMLHATPEQVAAILSPRWLRELRQPAVQQQLETEIHTWLWTLYDRPELAEQVFRQWAPSLAWRQDHFALWGQKDSALGNALLATATLDEVGYWLHQAVDLAAADQVEWLLTQPYQPVDPSKFGAVMALAKAVRAKEAVLSQRLRQAGVPLEATMNALGLFQSGFTGEQYERLFANRTQQWSDEPVAQQRDRLLMAEPEDTIRAYRATHPDQAWPLSDVRLRAHERAAQLAARPAGVGADRPRRRS